MGRARKRNDAPRLKPVEQINLSEKNFRRRLILCLVCLVVGIVAICFAVRSYFSSSDGWITVETNVADLNCSGDFTFSYLLGESELSATAENKKLSALYTEGTVKAYQLFSALESFDGVNNVWYLNQHPNEDVTVDPALYQAFSRIQESGERSVYFGPVYAMYRDLFYCEDDSQAQEYDPYRNEEAAAYCQEIASYATNPDSINLVLLGDNKVRLYVSGEYLALAEEYGFTCFVDFFWMKNAFIVDYLADLMIENGFTNGYLSSFDGFFRSLSTDSAITFNLYDRVDDTILVAGRAVEVPVKSRVFLRNYPIHAQDDQYYYTLRSGEIRFPYLDVADGLCKSATAEIVAYSRSESCAQVLLELIPVYTRGSLDTGALAEIANGGIDTICIQDRVIRYTDGGLTLDSLYRDYTLSPIPGK